LGEIKDKQWDMISFDVIKGYLKLYQSMLLGRRSFLVAHGKQVSVFDLIQNDWIQHIYFNDEVKHLLKDSETEYGVQQIFILFESGRVDIAEQYFSSDDSKWTLESEGQYMDGKIVKVAPDYQTQ
jgi:hypothetical protein